VKEHKHKGEVFHLDDSKGCFLEVIYKGTAGYLGVNLQRGTKDQPYSWTIPKYYGGGPTNDGIEGGGVPVTNIESGLRNLCEALMKHYQEEESRKAFDREEAGQALHKFVEGLG
jgi:hypothetical protein